MLNNIATATAIGICAVIAMGILPPLTLKLPV